MDQAGEDIGKVSNATDQVSIGVCQGVMRDMIASCRSRQRVPCSGRLRNAHLQEAYN